MEQDSFRQYFEDQYRNRPREFRKPYKDKNHRSYANQNNMQGIEEMQILDQKVVMDIERFHQSLANDNQNRYDLDKSRLKMNKTEFILKTVMQDSKFKKILDQQKSDQEKDIIQIIRNFDFYNIMLIISHLFILVFIVLMFLTGNYTKYDRRNQNMNFFKKYFLHPLHNLILQMVITSFIQIVNIQGFIFFKLLKQQYLKTFYRFYWIQLFFYITYFVMLIAIFRFESFQIIYCVQIVNIVCVLKIIIFGQKIIIWGRQY